MDVHLRSGRVQLGEVTKSHDPGCGLRPSRTGQADRKRLTVTLEPRIKIAERLILISSLGFSAACWAPGIPEPPQVKVPASAHRHKLPTGFRVKSTPVIGGLHHEYSLEIRTGARRCANACGSAHEGIVKSEIRRSKPALRKVTLDNPRAVGMRAILT